MSDAKPSPRWVALTLAANAGLVLAHAVVFAATRSRLVLAQGADSLMDVAAVIVLAISATVARRPHDADHPFGHGRAEPVGALLVAALAGVLAFEVGRSAIEALLGGGSTSIDASIAVVFVVKVAVKLGLLAALSKRARASHSPALTAIMVDARNDVAAASTSLVGYATIQLGWPRADAWLALPICMYIAYNGINLARENIGYLMGEAPTNDVVETIRSAAAGVGGVLAVTTVRAHFVGSELHVELAVVVAERASALEGHDVAVGVQRAVEALDRVAKAFVHVDIEGHDEDPSAVSDRVAPPSM